MCSIVYSAGSGVIKRKKVDTVVVIDGVKYGNTTCNIMQGRFYNAVLGDDGTYFESRVAQIIKGKIGENASLLKETSYERYSPMCIWQGWLYYCDQYRLLCREIQNDSEPEEILDSVVTFQIADGILYYISKDYELFAVDLDNGFEKKKIKSNVNEMRFSIESGWIYFCLETERMASDGIYVYPVYRIRTVGSSEEKICDIKSEIEGAVMPGPTLFCVVDGKIYYTEPYKYCYVLKILDMEGKNIEPSDTPILISGMDVFQVIDNWIYYLDSNDSHLFKMPADGSQAPKEIFSERAMNFYQLGDELHIHTISSIYSIDFDGNNQKRIQF